MAKAIVSLKGGNDGKLVFLDDLKSSTTAAQIKDAIEAISGGYKVVNVYMSDTADDLTGINPIDKDNVVFRQYIITKDNNSKPSFVKLPATKDEAVSDTEIQALAGLFNNADSVRIKESVKVSG